MFLNHFVSEHILLFPGISGATCSQNCSQTDKITEQQMLAAIVNSCPVSIIVTLGFVIFFRRIKRACTYMEVAQNNPGTLRSITRSHRDLALENLALRQ